jgi:hypothetical protein
MIHYPNTEEAKLELAKHVAQVHAESVSTYIKHLNCPANQKLQLLNAIIATAQQEVS